MAKKMVYDGELPVDSVKPEEIVKSFRVKQVTTVPEGGEPVVVETDYPVTQTVLEVKVPEFATSVFSVALVDDRDNVGPYGPEDTITANDTIAPSPAGPMKFTLKGQVDE